MPPRSTNAPNSAMFLTTPLRIWPISSSPSSLSFWILRRSSISLRRLTTMFRRCSSILRMTHSMVRSMYSSMICGRRMSTWLRGQEHVDADVDEQAALDLLEHLAGDDVAFLVLGEDRVPLLLPLRLAVGELNGAVFALDGFEQHLDGVAGLRRRRVVAVFLPLVDLDDAFGLVPDVDDDVVAADLEHLAGDDLVGFVVLLVALQPVRDGLVEVEVVLVGGFVVGNVELAEEVAVDHSVRVRRASPVRSNWGEGKGVSRVKVSPTPRRTDVVRTSRE